MFLKLLFKCIFLYIHPTANGQGVKRIAKVIRNAGKDIQSIVREHLQVILFLEHITNIRKVF